MRKPLASQALSYLCIMLFITSKEIALLEKTLKSIKKQTNKKWILYIVLPNEKIIDLETIKTTLNNIKIKKYNLLFSPHPPHKIINRITTEYIFFIATGDYLHKEFIRLFFQKKKILPNLHIFYTDHTTIESNTHFKPDWNPDYLDSFNYISHAVIFKQSDLLKINLSKTTKKDYFHQLLLKISKQYNKSKIYHLPISLLTLKNTQKNYKNPLTNYFYSNNSVSKKDFPLSKPNPLVSILIPTKNQFKLLKQCVTSLLEKTNYSNFELLIINNKSNDSNTVDYLKQLDQCHNIRVLSYPYAFNYSAINNFAVKQAKGSIITFLNNDTEILNSNWLDEMVKHALRPEIGCVGAKLYYPDGTIQHGGVILGIYGSASHAHKHFPKDHAGYFNRLIAVHNVSAVTAACLVMRKEIFEQVGGFDQVNLKVAYNDVDLCLKVLQQGYRNLWTPYAELIHHESKSRGKKRSWWQRYKLRKEERFLQQKWGELLLNDPAYNPNLTLKQEDFSVKKISDS